MMSDALPLSYFRFCIILLLFYMASLTQAQAPLFCAESVFNQRIPAHARYIPEARIGSFRHNQAEWSAPIYRLDDTASVALVTISNEYSGRTVHWRIPSFAMPATASDHHLIVMGDGWLYEMWNARWQSESQIIAGGMFRFPVNGTGISNPSNQRVTAAGFAVSAGMVIREDFMQATTETLNQDQVLHHALTMSLHFDMIGNNSYVYPAVGGESAGRADTVTGIPMGAQFALAPHLPDSALAHVHPLTRNLVLASRDYGIFINDTNNAPLYHGKYVGNIRIEPTLIQELYGVGHDVLIAQVQSEIADIISQYGFYRVEYDLASGVCTSVEHNP